MAHVLLGCVWEQWKRSKSNMQLTNSKHWGRSSELANQGRNNFLDLSALWPECSQSIMNQHRFFAALVCLHLLFLLPGIRFPHLFPCFIHAHPSVLNSSERAFWSLTLPHLLNILFISFTELLSIWNYWVYLLVYCLCLPTRIMLLEGKGLVYITSDSPASRTVLGTHRGSINICWINVWDVERTKSVGDKTAHFAKQKQSHR